jgi:ribosomal-protein-alanine N-acetyltransferase
VRNELVTERLRLRPLSTDDLEDLAVIYGDPEVMRYRLHTQPASREQTRTMLEQYLHHWKQYDFGRWAILEQTQHQVIGHAGLEFLDGTPEVELNYLIARSYWGVGLATEAARVILQYGFETLHLPQTIAISKPENLASRRVLEKLGMCYEAEVQYYGVTWLRYTLSRDRWRTSTYPWR